MIQEFATDSVEELGRVGYSIFIICYLLEILYGLVSFQFELQRFEPISHNLNYIYSYIDHIYVVT